VAFLVRYLLLPFPRKPYQFCVVLSRIPRDIPSDALGIKNAEGWSAGFNAGGGNWLKDLMSSDRRLI